MHDELALERMDRDGAIQEALGGITRGQALKAALLGGAGAVAGSALLGDEALAQSRPSRRTDLRVLQLALVLEHLGANFYGEAVREGELDGELARFARTLRDHERRHVRFVQSAIRGLGGRPQNPPRFDFGDVTKDARKFRTASEILEQTCVEALNGAGPLVTKRTLAGAAQLVSVEARHVAWVRDIAGKNPVPEVADRGITLAQTRSRARRTGFIKGRI